MRISGGWCGGGVAVDNSEMSLSDKPRPAQTSALEKAARSSFADQQKEHIKAEAGLCLAGDPLQGIMNFFSRGFSYMTRAFNWVTGRPASNGKTSVHSNNNQHSADAGKTDAAFGTRLKTDPVKTGTGKTSDKSFISDQHAQEKQNNVDQKDIDWMDIDAKLAMQEQIEWNKSNNRGPDLWPIDEGNPSLSMVADFPSKGGPVQAPTNLLLQAADTVQVESKTVPRSRIPKCPQPLIKKKDTWDAYMTTILGVEKYCNPFFDKDTHPEAVAHKKITPPSFKEVYKDEYSPNQNLKNWFEAQGCVVAKNHGFSYNCLIISLLQHATGDYVSDHRNEAVELKRWLVEDARVIGTATDSLNDDNKAATFLIDEINYKYGCDMQVLFVQSNHEGHPAAYAPLLGHGKNRVVVMQWVDSANKSLLNILASTNHHYEAVTSSH